MNKIHIAINALKLVCWNLEEEKACSPSCPYLSKNPGKTQYFGFDLYRCLLFGAPLTSDGCGAPFEDNYWRCKDCLKACK